MGSVSKGAVFTIPLFTVFSIATGKPWGPSDQNKNDKYYLDGYMELLPSSSTSDKLRMKVCNSQLKHVKDMDNIMECTSTVSIIQTESLPSFSPRERSPLPLAPFGNAFFCAFAFAFIYPFTILVCFFVFPLLSSI